MKKFRRLFALGALFVLLAGCEKDPTQVAVDLVGQSVQENNLSATVSDLKSKPNPKGEGIIVYLDAKSFRPAVWIVIDSQAYAMNSPAKMVTPSVPWSREADDDTWKKTHFDKFMGAEEALKAVQTE